MLFAGKTKYASALVPVLIASAMMFTGCSGKNKTSNKKNSTSKEAAAVDYDVTKQVTLGDYSNLKLTITGDYSEETYLKDLISSAGYKADDTKTVVENDSIVNVDYVGKKDGTAFEGGSAEDVNIDVANNKDATSGTGYIDGFSSGLVGAAVGSSVDSEVTFPSDYQASDLAGATVTFTFKINYIAKPVEESDLDDDYVTEHFKNYGYKTVNDLKAAAKENAESDKKAAINTAVIDEMEKNSKVTLPDGLLDKRVDAYKKRFKETYVTSGTLKSYLKQFNMTEKQFNEKVRENMEKSLKEELIFEAVAKKENIKFDQKGYDKYLKSMIKQSGVKDANAFYKEYGTSVSDGKAYIKKMYVGNKACQFIADKADVTVNPSTGSAS